MAYAPWLMVFSALVIVAVLKERLLLPNSDCRYVVFSLSCWGLFVLVIAGGACY